MGTWGPDTGFPVAPGYNVSTMFDVTVAEGAPVGAYNVTLELIDVEPPADPVIESAAELTAEPVLVEPRRGSRRRRARDGSRRCRTPGGTRHGSRRRRDRAVVFAVEPTVLATETGTITVNANVATVLWGDTAAEARHPGRRR